MAATKLGRRMWSTDKIHKERLADQLSTMEQSPHENPVLAAKGNMQHTWFKSKLKEQGAAKKYKIKLKARIALED